MQGKKTTRGQSRVFFHTLTSKCQLGKWCWTLVSTVSVVSSHLLVLESDAIVMLVNAHKEREEDWQTSETTNPNQFWLVAEDSRRQWEYWQNLLQFTQVYTRLSWTMGWMWAVTQANVITRFRNLQRQRRLMRRHDVWQDSLLSLSELGVYKIISLLQHWQGVWVIC